MNTNTVKQETCAERVQRAFESRIDDIETMLNPQREDVWLGDDGTMDTVLCLGDEELRFSDTSSYRDEETGELDLDALLDDEFDGIADEMYDRFYEYGLAFDYVEPGTFTDQQEGYLRYQISYGGPSEEFRFYVSLGPQGYVPHRIEFWFLDWFDGAHLNVTDDERVQRLWDQFAEVAESAIRESIEA